MSNLETSAPHLAISDRPAIPVETSGGAESDVTTLDVGTGEAVKLDKLGPLIVNSDGVRCSHVTVDQADDGW